jgi:hypothetical protein
LRYVSPTIAVLALLALLACGSVRAQDSPHIGIKIRTLTLELRKQHKLAEDLEGALVTAVILAVRLKKRGLLPAMSLSKPEVSQSLLLRTLRARSPQRPHRAVTQLCCALRTGKASVAR